MQRRQLMQSLREPRGSAELRAALAPEDERIDHASLRVLAIWISKRAGLDPEVGAMIDRGFVVAQAHA